MITAKTTVTQKGQITIPKAFRQKFGVKPYSKVKLEMGKNNIKITPVKDILDLAGKFKPKKEKSALKAREEMSKKYQRF